MQNGQVYQDGGTTGDQFNYGLVGVPSLDSTNAASPFSSVNHSLAPVPREEANLEAEKGETVLTDMNNDGDFELYDIGGNRHHKGGTPLNLPPQSFIYSDTSSMKLDRYELAEMGINSKKKITPAKVSKGYQLNNFIGLLDDEHSDNITRDTAEYMLTKNKKSLSQLAFLQEAKKRFEDGVPLAAYPYLQEKGINPIEFSQQIQDISQQEAEQQMMTQLPFESQMQILKMKAEMAMQQQAAMAQQDAQQSGMIPPSQGGQMGVQGENIQAEAMMPQQGGMPPMGPPQQGGMPPMGPPPGMMPPQPPMQQPAMARRGGQISNLYKAQEGVETKGMREFTAQAPIYNAVGECIMNCRKITVQPVFDFEIGAGMSAGKINDEFTGSGKLTSGFSFNPNMGQGGLDAYIGGNIGGRATSINQDDVALSPFANLVTRAGYSGYLPPVNFRNRQGLPFGLGAFYNKSLMGNEGNILGGYGQLGNFNITGGYNFDTNSPQFTAGIGIPIRKTGGGDKKKNVFEGLDEETVKEIKSLSFLPKNMLNKDWHDLEGMSDWHKYQLWENYEYTMKDLVPSFKSFGAGDIYDLTKGNYAKNKLKKHNVNINDINKIMSKAGITRDEFLENILYKENPWLDYAPIRYGINKIGDNIGLNKKYGGNLYRATDGVENVSVPESQFVHEADTTGVYVPPIELDTNVKPDYQVGNTYDTLITKWNPTGLFMGETSSVNQHTLTDPYAKNKSQMQAMAASNPVASVFQNIGYGVNALGEWTGYWKEGGEGFKPHMMYDPKTGKGYMANTYEDHLRMKEMNYLHKEEMRNGGQPLPKAQEGLYNDSIPSYNFDMDSLYVQPLDNLYVHPSNYNLPLYDDGLLNAPEIETGNIGENNDPTVLNPDQIIEILTSQNAQLIDQYNKSYQANIDQFNKTLSNIPSTKQQMNMFNVTGNIDPNKVEIWEDHIEKGGPAPSSYDANYSEAYKDVYGTEPTYDDSNKNTGNNTNIYNIDQPVEDGNPDPKGRPGYVLRTPDANSTSSDQPTTPGQAVGLPLDYSNTENPYYVGAQWAFQKGGTPVSPQGETKNLSKKEALKQYILQAEMKINAMHQQMLSPEMSEDARMHIQSLILRYQNEILKMKFELSTPEKEKGTEGIGTIGGSNINMNMGGENYLQDFFNQVDDELPLAKRGKSIEFEGKTYKINKLEKMLESGDPVKIQLAKTILGIDTETIDQKIENINVSREDTEGTSLTYQGGTSVWSDRYLGDDQESYRADRYRAYSDYAKTKGLTPLPEDEYHQLYARYQKQNDYLKNNLSADELSNPSWDRLYNYVPCGENDKGCVEIDGKKWKRDGKKQDANFMYNKYFADNEELPPLTQDQIKHVQAGYVGGQALVLNEESYDDFMQTGVADQTTQFLDINGKPVTMNISPADGFFGNTTNQQYESQFEETPGTPCANAEGMEAACVEVGGTWTPYNEQDPANSCKCDKKIPPPTEIPPPTKDTPFWLQDELGLANAMDAKMSLKKRYPWAPQYDQIQIDATFDDPTREIAAIGEQASMVAEAAGAFGGSKRGITAALAAQGKAATQIADVVNRVHANNIKTANDIKVKNAELQYKTQVLNNNELKQLYDNTVLTEENYDNSLRKANAAITTQLQAAHTNRANTANLNSIYPQFDIDPSTGGMINITDPKAFYADPNYKDPKTSLEDYKTTITELKKILPKDQWDRLPMYNIPNTTKSNTTFAQQNAPIIASGYPGGKTARWGRETNRKSRILKKGGQLKNWFGN